MILFFSSSSLIQERNACFRDHGSVSSQALKPSLGTPSSREQDLITLVTFGNCFANLITLLLALLVKRRSYSWASLD